MAGFKAPNVTRRIVSACAVLSLGLLLSATSVDAQTLVANDDDYGVPNGGPLEVPPFGVLDNDTLDGGPAAENPSVTAELVSDVNHGVLTLNSDGSFTYTPDSTFVGIDAFIYRAVGLFAAVSQEATVTLTACTGGPQIFSCWQEAAFLAKSVELGFSSFQEGFEDDAVWGIARSPATAPSISSMGILWETNHPDPPAGNEITTGNGPAQTGQYGVWDDAHGYATGTTLQCAQDPPPECLFHDGFMGTNELGQSALHGVGGFITGTTGANVAIVLDGTGQIDLGSLPDPGHHFFGVIDAGAQGFTRFEFRELDGKVGQERRIFGDDFSLLVGVPAPVPTLSIPGLLGVSLLLATVALWYQRRPRAASLPAPPTEQPSS
jgi:hypothetical protein